MTPEDDAIPPPGDAIVPASARPSIFSASAWRLMPALDVLPAPWGEHILAGLCMAVGLARPGRRRPAAAWAAAQRGHRTWPLVASLCAFRGRWAARTWLLGLRDPADFRRRLVIEGESHLDAASGGTILLGFHVGPPGADLALRVAGHRLIWLGWEPRLDWSARRPPAWRPLFEPSQYLSVLGDWSRWPIVLHRARRLLLEGATVHTLADGGGKELFAIPLPGGPLVVRAGWLSLHRHTGARVLPVLTHLDGRTLVVTIHPPLPVAAGQSRGDVDAWREALTGLLEDYVRRFPAQCIGLAFPDPTPERA